MNKNKIILLLGIWVALLPGLGFQSSVENFFLVSSGIIIALLAFLVYREGRGGASDEEESQSVSEGETDKYQEEETKEDTMGTITIEDFDDSSVSSKKKN